MYTVLLPIDGASLAHTLQILWCEAKTKTNQKWNLCFAFDLSLRLHINTHLAFCFRAFPFCIFLPPRPVHCTDTCTTYFPQCSRTLLVCCVRLTCKMHIAICFTSTQMEFSRYTIIAEAVKQFFRSVVVCSNVTIPSLQSYAFLILNPVAFHRWRYISLLKWVVWLKVSRIKKNSSIFLLSTKKQNETTMSTISRDVPICVRNTTTTTTTTQVALNMPYVIMN